MKIQPLGRKGAATCQGERKKKLMGKMLSCHRSRRQIRARSVGGLKHALAACANGLGVGTDISQAPGYCQALVQSPQRGSRPTPPQFLTESRKSARPRPSSTTATFEIPVNLTFGRLLPSGQVAAERGKMRQTMSSGQGCPRLARPAPDDLGTDFSLWG